MPALKTGWWPVMAVAAAGAGLLVWQWRETELLRAEASSRRGEATDLMRLRREREALRAAQIPEAELETLRSDRAALVRLRAEIEALKAGSAAAAARQPSRLPAPAAPPEPPVVSSSTWKNSGRATPGATLETALWAARTGDVDALAGLVSLEAPARSRAEAIINQLPPDQRVQYETPEKLVALFTARDIPATGSYRLSPDVRTMGSEAMLIVDIESEQAGDGGGKKFRAQNRRLRLRSDDGGWKLIVPESAVERYGAILSGATAAEEKAK